MKVKIVVTRKSIHILSHLMTPVRRLDKHVIIDLPSICSFPKLYALKYKLYGKCERKTFFHCMFLTECTKFYGTSINPLLIFRSESSEQINGKSSESYKSCETTSDAKRII